MRDATFENKLAHPQWKLQYIESFYEQKNLGKHFNSTLKKSTISINELSRTTTLIEKFNLTNRQELAKQNIEKDVLLLTITSQNYIDTCTPANGKYSLLFYSTPSFTWKADIYFTGAKLD